MMIVPCLQTAPGARESRRRDAATNGKGFQIPGILRPQAYLPE